MIAEESARRQLLPALAASVAYDNLHRWKVEEYGGHNWQVPVEVGFGAEGKLDVDIEKLYRAAEKEASFTCFISMCTHELVKRATSLQLRSSMLAL